MAACCWACVDNDEGEPSHLENNWYALTYNPNAGPLEQEIYAIYEQTGIPIFLSDTLGAQIRYDLGGNPYTYYNMFSPGYNYTNYTSTYTYSLEREEADLEAMVDLLGNYALRPYFRNDYGEEFVGKFGPHALVVLDSITRGSTPDTLLMDLGVIGLSTRYTMKTGTGSSASNFTGARDLTEEQKEKFGWNFAMYELERFFRNTYMAEYVAYRVVLREIPQEFTGTGTQNPFQLNANMETADWNERGSTSRTSFNIKNYNIDVNEPRKYGILAFMQNNGSSVYFPNWKEDLTLYMNLIYNKSDEEIRAENAEFPYVIRRYEMLLALLRQCGLTQFIYGNHE